MVLKLELQRKEFYPDRTIGGFYINGKFCYFTLEDYDRRLEAGGQKVPGQTAIPRGRYRVTISYSNRYKKLMPQLLDVPDFTGVRIHTGNVPTDTEGCILVAMKYDAPTHNILDSRIAFEDFYCRLEEGLEAGEVWIEIT